MDLKEEEPNGNFEGERDSNRDDVYVRTLLLNLDYGDVPNIKELFCNEATDVFDRCREG